MNKALVEQYVKLEREHWWFRVRATFIRQHLARHLGNTNGLRILNIGAAGGATSQLLEQFGSVTSVEIEKHFVEHLKEIDISVIEGSVLQLPFGDAEFDLVCAFDVIEHVAEDAVAMSEIARVCKRGASVCITVPASMSLWSNHDIVNGHYKRYTKQQLLTLIGNTSGLATIACDYFNSLLFPAIWFARKFGGSKRSTAEKLQSDFDRYKTSGTLNRFAEKIFGLEVNLLRHWKFPFGVSLIAFLKKKSNNN